MKMSARSFQLAKAGVRCEPETLFEPRDEQPKGHEGRTRAGIPQKKTSPSCDIEATAMLV